MRPIRISPAPAKSMEGFFGATSLFIAPVLLGTPWLGRRANEIGRLTLLLAGLWYSFLGLKGLLVN